MTIYNEDLVLAKRIENQNPSADEELFTRFKDRIEIIIRARLRCHHEHPEQKDLFNEIWQFIFENLRMGRYNGKAPLINYILGIVYRRIGNYRRKRKREPFSRDDLDTFEGEDDLELEVEHRDMRNVIRKQIEKLKSQHKKIIYLRYYNDMSYCEISKTLNIPVTTVKSRLHEANKKLAQTIAKNVEN